MKLETIGKLRENIIKDRGWSEVRLTSIYEKGDKILFCGTSHEIGFNGEADKEGKVIKMQTFPLHIGIQRKERVKQILESHGYKFEHPTLVLEGRDGWFIILTPHRTPHQAIVHWDGTQPDFFATVPEQIE